jgi:hypothetical protein
MSTEISSYEQQAIDFLNSTSTGFTSTYKTHDFYFYGDKETRDIYTIVLKNKLHRYRFNFGQSIANAGEHPTPYSVLACLQKSDVGTFNNFCDEFGYNSDSRKAFKTYKAVKREWENVKKLFSPEQIEMLQEIN